MLSGFFCKSQAPVVQTFNCTGASQTFVVPSCVSSITVEAWGAGGGAGGPDSNPGSDGGGGAYASSVLSVVPGQILTVTTGCGGQGGGGCQAAGGFGPGGFGLGNGGNGGNPGGSGCSGPGGGGGGGTGILNGGTILLVAGGGGGGGGGGNLGGGAAGGGGGQNGNSVGTTMGGTLGASPNNNGLAGMATVGDGAGGGGGGGGLAGGGGGNVPGTDMGGAGGAGGTNLGTTVLNGNNVLPGNAGGAGLCAGCAVGGVFGGTAPGGSGILILSYIVIPAPAVTANASANPVCAGSPLTLTGGGATTYTWTGGVTNGVAFTPSATATYTVTGEMSGCTNTAVISVNVNALPIVTANSGTICVGQQTTALNASGASTYVWSPGTGLNATTGATVNASPSSTTTYTVTGTDTNGCSNTAQAPVTVNPLPVMNVNSAAICLGQQTATLSANGATSYTWFPTTALSSVPGPTVTAAPALTTTYIVSGTDINTCTNTAQSIVLVNPLPIITVNSAAICMGQTNALLSAGGANTYTWLPSAGLSSSNGANVTANPPTTTSYTVAGTNNNSCTNTAVSTVTVNPLPNVTVNSAAICIGQQAANLTASGAATYVWAPTSGLNSASGSTVLATPSSNSSYTVTGTDGNSCKNTAIATITVNALPLVNASPQASMGCAPLCVKFSNLLPSQGIYEWNFGDGQISSTSAPLHCFTSEGVFSVSMKLTDPKGCVNSSSANITVFPVPTADFYYTPKEPIINISSEVSFSDASFGAPITEWNWFFMNTNQFQSSLQHPQFTYTEAGNYLVALVVKSNKGCKDTVLKPILINDDYALFVPNAFTPNGDGVNDVFQPKGFGFTKYTLFIFDRWGEKIFESKVFENGWDGSYTRKSPDISQNDVYIWKIKLTNNSGKIVELTGHVTLLK